MSRIQRLEDIKVWQKSRELTEKIYETTNSNLFYKDFVLRSQIRKASLSIMCNIAEGFERGGNKEFMQFLAIAKGSVGELISQLYVAGDQGYIDKSKFKSLYALADEIIHMIGGLIKYLKNSELKGTKYK